MKRNQFAIIFLSMLAFLGCATHPGLSEKSDQWPIDRDPAAAIEKGNYQGVAAVKGNLRLMTSKGLADFVSGAVSVDLGSPSFLYTPGKYFRGDRLLTIKTQEQEISFKIPKESVFDNGKISVHQKSSGQNAHLTIEEQLKMVNTYEESGTTSCTHSGFCMMCGLGYDGKMDCGSKTSPVCPGSQKTLYKVELFDRTIKLHIYNDEGSAEIRTSDKREIMRTPIKTLSDCG